MNYPNDFYRHIKPAESTIWVELRQGHLIEPTAPVLTFVGKDHAEIVRFEYDGDIYVHGKLIENDKEVVQGLRAFLTNAGYM